jgi:hypothetical protein
MGSIFEEIMEKCNNKKVKSICKKLDKKLSFKSGKDVENLCHLIYWLYILNEIELAKKCIVLTHKITFDQNYNVWTFIHAIWGIEIKILRNEGKNNMAEKIIQEMDKQLKMSTKIETPEMAEIRENGRRERIDFEFISCENKIEHCLKNNNQNFANGYRFVALLKLIEYTETGFFPKLNKEKKKIENTIEKYIGEIIK